MAGIKDTKIIKGQPHLLTYITPNEVEKLKALGGQETMTPEGIPAYPEYDNYGFSSQADFDSGDVSKSNDPNVRGEGPGQNRVTASQLAAINAKEKEADAKEKEAERQKVLAELSVTPMNRNKSLNKFQLSYNNFRRRQKQKFAQKRAFQKYKDLEKYVDSFDDYTMDGVKAAIARGYKVDGNILGNSGSVNFTGYNSNPLTNPDATDPSLGYDFSNLKEGMKTLTSNRGTSIEKTRSNLYDINSPIKVSLIQTVLDKARPDTQVTAMNTLNKAADYNILAGDPNISREKLEALANRGKTPDQINPSGGGGGGGQPYIPYLPEEEVEDEYTNDFTYRFGDNQDVIYENYGTPGYRTTAADGGIMGTRARRAMGGIMERVDKRQQFFLGGIGKAIKGVVGGVVDATKKVLKSDVGKMALLAAGAYYTGGALGGTGGFNNFATLGSKAMQGARFLGKKALFTNGSLDFGKAAILGASALPFFMKQPENPDIGMGDRGGSLIDPLTGKEATPAEMRESIELAKLEAGDDADKLAAIDAKYNNMLNLQYQAGLPDATPYNLYGSRGYRTTRAATGGRIGFNGGGTTITLMDGTKVQIPSGSYNSSGSLKDKIYSSSKGDLLREEIIRKLSFANGGRIGKAEGGLLDLGGMEKDYRAEGGFVPIGEYEKKDDVPARLSVNEFVMTADAVRGAGQGDIDKGAEIMENMMKNLENGGTVSEESQGNKGAQQMFETSERLGAII